MMISIHNKIENPQDCLLGILIIKDVQNLPSHEKLDMIKCDVSNSLKGKYSQKGRKEMKAQYPIYVYASYYKKFGYSYHLLLQLESIIHGKSMPAISTLIDIMFIAEMKNMLLTAGHDMDKISSSLCLKRATGETYTTLNGNTAMTVPGDIMIEDGEGIISSILRGPDSRTSIKPQTNCVLFTVYAPFGIKEKLVHEHLNDIESYIKLTTKGSITCFKNVCCR